jgi:hypothetical protein
MPPNQLTWSGRQRVIRSVAVIGAGNIWLELHSRGCISLYRETGEDCCSERVAGDVDAGNVVLFS